MQAQLAKSVRDSRTGTFHPMGEVVTIVRPVKDEIRGTQLQIKFQDESTTLVLPEELKG
jgi:hypothetical protein